MDLFEAVKRNDLTAVETALAHGADVTALDPSGKTPLDWAVDLEHDECEDLIRRHRVKIQTEALNRAVETLLSEQRIGPSRKPKTKRSKARK